MEALTPQEIARAQERLREEIRQKEELLKAYSLVAKDLHSNGQSTLYLETPITARSRSQFVGPELAYGYKTKVVRQAVENIGKPFKIKDIQRYLAENGTNLSIESVTTAMNRIREGMFPKIIVKRPGKGRRPTIFEKA